MSKRKQPEYQSNKSDRMVEHVRQYLKGMSQKEKDRIRRELEMEDGAEPKKQQTINWKSQDYDWISEYKFDPSEAPKWNVVTSTSVPRDHYYMIQPQNFQLHYLDPGELFYKKPEPVVDDSVEVDFED